MPKLTRWFIKTALLYFVSGLFIGVLMKAQPLFDLPPFLITFRPEYFHILMVGWITQMIMGVAFWFFPRHSKESPRGLETIGWFTFSFLNAGLLLRVVSESLATFYPNSIWGRILVISALMQWFAGVAFVQLIWPRVKEKPSS